MKPRPALVSCGSGNCGVQQLRCIILRSLHSIEEALMHFYQKRIFGRSTSYGQLK